MKKLIYPILMLLIVSACKYEDGPKLSLRSKAHRAINTWFLNQAFESGTDKTETYKNTYRNYQIEIKGDKNYEIKYQLYGILDYKETGTWAFSSDKTTLNFTPKVGNASASKWKILRLKEKETWVIQNIDGKDVELHMMD